MYQDKRSKVSGMPQPGGDARPLSAAAKLSWWCCRSPLPAAPPPGGGTPPCARPPADAALGSRASSRLPAQAQGTSNSYDGRPGSRLKHSRSTAQACHHTTTRWLTAHPATAAHIAPTCLHAAHLLNCKAGLPQQAQRGTWASAVVVLYTGQCGRQERRGGLAAQAATLACKLFRWSRSCRA